MESVGGLLRRAREARKETLEDVAKSTRISVAVLEALETDRFGVIAASVYIKGFLRSYAKHLGLDAQEVIQKYLRFTEQQEEPDELDEWDEIEMELHTPRRSPRRRWMSVAAAAAIAVVAIVLTVTWRAAHRVREHAGGQSTAAVAGPISGTRTDAGEHGGAGSGGEEEVRRGGEGEPGTAFEEPMIEWHKLELKAVARERTWLRVFADGRPLGEVTLDRGEQRTWEADEYFELDVGNGIGVELYVDGEFLGTPGDNRRIVEGLVVNEDGMSR